MARQSITLQGEKKMFADGSCRASSRKSLKVKRIAGGALLSSELAAATLRLLPVKGYGINRLLRQSCNPRRPSTVQRQPQWAAGCSAGETECLWLALCSR